MMIYERPRRYTGRRRKRWRLWLAAAVWIAAAVLVLTVWAR